MGFLCESPDELHAETGNGDTFGASSFVVGVVVRSRTSYDFD